MFGDLVITHDMMAQGTHRLADADPADVAWKLVATNLSDLAAKGATPLGVLLGYMLGDGDWDRAFAHGLTDALAHYETRLWGGDTVAGARTAPRAIGLTAIGRASHLPVPARSGALPGDALWVTGTLGVALAGYRALTGAGPRDPVAEAHFNRPVPRLGEGRALAPIVHAMMDVSDGLLLDASRMADASGVTISIASAAVPLCTALGDDRAAGLGWGDDYELLFALPHGVTPPCPAARIGTVVARTRHPLIVDGAPPPAGQSLGWQHSAP